MNKNLIRTICIAFVLTLCLPMAACDIEFGGLVGELLANIETAQGDIPLDEWQSNYGVEDIPPEIIETTFDPGWVDDYFTDPPIDPEVNTENETEIEWFPEYTEIPDTTEQPEVLPPEPVPVIAAFSWDLLTKSDCNGKYYEEIFADGLAYMAWADNAVANIGLIDVALHVWGWVSFYTEVEGTVGYSIDGNTTVYSENFTDTAEQGVQDHIHYNIPGAQSACRMDFDIPVHELSAGEHTVRLIAKDPDGNEEVIKEFTLMKELPFIEKTDAASAFLHWSFDSFYVNDELYFEMDGMAEEKLNAQDDLVYFAPDQTPDQISFWGWTSFECKTESFGYYVVNKSYEIVYSDEFLVERPDVVNAGLKNGVGFRIDVPIAELEVGNRYRIGIVEKLETGTVVKLYELTLEI